MAESWRTSPLPENWPALRAAALERDGGRCRQLIDGKRCTASATDVDHVVAAALGGGDDLDNLASLCGAHHAAKTGREAIAMRWARPGARLNRPKEQHPGLRRREV